MPIKCPDPECRETLQTHISRKLDKVTAWTVIVVVGIPLMATGLVVWAEVMHSGDKFVARAEMEQHSRDLAICKEFMRQVPDDLKELKESIDKLRQEVDKKQAESNQDIKEILRHLRDSH